jgi:hypothetical protein
LAARTDREVVSATAVRTRIPITMNENRRDDPDARQAAEPRTKAGVKLNASILPRSAIEIALNCTGFFVGILIMTGDYAIAGRWLSAPSREFLRSPKAMVWIFVVAGQFAFWATIVEPLWRWRSKLRNDYGLRLTREIRIKLAAAVIFFVLPGLFLVCIVPDSKLAHHDLKMGFVNLIAMIVAVDAVMGIWYVRAALETAFGANGSGPRSVHSLEAGVKVLVELRADLQRFITLLGTMVALATLAKGALRQAILATGGTAAEFPPEYVLLQGAYFTGLLALVYIPTYSVLAAVGSDLVESVYPVRETALDWEHLSRWQGNRKSLEEILQLRSGAVRNLRASISILAPAASSIIAVMLGGAGEGSGG